MPLRYGLEKQMQTNHLSHFLLVHELFPLIEKAAEKNGEARIVNHSSLARAMGNKNDRKLSKQFFEPQRIEGERRRSSHGGDGENPTWQRYQQTKLANVCFTYGLHDRLAAMNNNKIKVLVCAPGIACTSLQVTSADKSQGGNMSGFLGWFFQKLPVSQSAEDGALPALTCMLDEKVNSRELWVIINFSSKCFTITRIFPSKHQIYTENNKKRYRMECRN